MTEKPLVISSPLPRTLDLIFTPERLAELRAHYRIVETTDEELPNLPAGVLAEARYIIGQPPIDSALLARLANLRCIFNVESNLYMNMPYDEVFQRGIHVVTTGAVFAQPVAEIGLGLALSLLRQIAEADADFRAGREKWGGEGNTRARLLAGSDVAILGFGDLGKATARVLSGFRPRLRVYDPWLAPQQIRAAGAEPVDLHTALTQSDVIFVTASVTSENEGFLGAKAFASMRPGAAFILLSRAGVVDFEALMDAVASGHIVAASDVFPEEPLPLDHRVRKLDGFLRSAHRAGAMDVVFAEMGEMVLQDMALLDKGLPPQLCRRAERETVARMRSKPVKVN
ncbi:hydroxyacid dehydrogenase [Tabrizicola sp. J26]|uniref:hydroxyacid dehydrogenase n=1 Tax=Alitabrizicola rongguiensis TaxID=2909234 RepID=UPI001F37CA3E|nr:hydroxyacid dehydrogenase [Tabrizicola rongguiensis]MCF1707380.1 hydroxyacid dehydrogenase [Tabrizicola rongguiensis]